AGDQLALQRRLLVQRLRVALLDGAGVLADVLPDRLLLLADRRGRRRLVRRRILLDDHRRSLRPGASIPARSALLLLRLLGRRIVGPRRAGEREGGEDGECEAQGHVYSKESARSKSLGLDAADLATSSVMAPAL